MTARIKFLCQRDGIEQTQQWCRRTADLYATAVSVPEHFAHKEPFRSRFKTTVKVFIRFSEKEI